MLVVQCFQKVPVYTYGYSQSHGVQLSFAQMATEDGAHHTDQEPQKLCHELGRNGEVRGHCRDSRLQLLPALLQPLWKEQQRHSYGGGMVVVEC